LRLPAKPEDASNRRVTIIVQYLRLTTPPDEPKSKIDEKKGAQENVVRTKGKPG
jgi:hypothetical protein